MPAWFGPGAVGKGAAICGNLADGLPVLVADLRRLGRWELIGETVRLALDEIAGMAPGWLGPRIRAGWEERYGRRVEASRLPKGEDARWAWAERVAADGGLILADIAGDPDAAWLTNLPQVNALASIWQQQCTKRSTTWEGYKFHTTEGCDDDLPHLITDVQTSAATTTDVVMLETIQADLVDRDRAPHEQYADTGYVTAEAIRAAAEAGITLLGPVVCDSSWQAKAGQGFDRASFIVDWDTRSAICPMGKLSTVWRDQRGEHGTGAAIRFSDADCAACPRRSDCTRGVQGRQITLPPRDIHEVQLANRVSQTDPHWRRGYNRRAGVEATISEAVRGYGLRHTKHRGLARTHVRHVLIACGMNAARIADWTRRGNAPARQRAGPRFKRLCTQLTTAS